jgi:hypothetical protein
MPSLTWRGASKEPGVAAGSGGLPMSPPRRTEAIGPVCGLMTSASRPVEQEPELACPVSQPDWWEAGSRGRSRGGREGIARIALARSGGSRSKTGG